MYNPFDVLLLFSKREFGPYWFETGTPTFLIETLLRRQVDIPSLDGLRSDDALLSRFDVRDMAPEALLFQTGYLTIRDEERAFDGTPLYRLGYPNHEVRRSLNASLLAALTPPDATRRNPGLTLVERLRARDFAGIERLVRGLFASIPYEWHTRNEIARYEGYYASVFYAWLAAVGLDVTVEDSSSRGRADLAVRFAGDVFCSSSSARGPRGARRPVTLDLEGTRDGQLIPPHPHATWLATLLTGPLASTSSLSPTKASAIHTRRASDGLERASIPNAYTGRRPAQVGCRVRRDREQTIGRGSVMAGGVARAVSRTRAAGRRATAFRHPLFFRSVTRTLFAVLALSGAVGSAHADVLVSNIGKTDDQTVSVYDENTRGQIFTTGTAKHGFELRSIDLHVHGTPATPSKLTVTIQTVTRDILPTGDVVHTLTNPSSITTGINTFLAPSGATLAAATEYAVVVDYRSTNTDDFRLTRTTSRAEDSGGADGWRVDDAAVGRNDQGDGGGMKWHRFFLPHKIRVNGKYLDIAKISDVRFTSAPHQGDTYGRGEAIEIAVTFSRKVEVSGTVLATLFVGSTEPWRVASYHDGSGTDTLRFRYVVKSTDVDTDGISIGLHTLAGGGDPTLGVQGGGRIVAVGTTQDARLNSTRTASTHQVDGSKLAPVRELTVSKPPVTGVGLWAAFPPSRFASARHKGAGDRPQVIVAFGKPLAAFDAETPSVAVTGGTVAHVARHTEEGLANAWIFWLKPAGTDAMTFRLLAGLACRADAICTEDGTKLTRVPEARTIPGPASAAPGPAVSIERPAGGTRSPGGAVVMTLSLGDAVTVTASGRLPTLNITADGAAEEPEPVPALPPLTASLEDVPAEHDGSEFTFRVRFNVAPSLSFRVLRDESFAVTGGTVRRALRVDGRNDLREIHVKPAGYGDVTITLTGGRACGTTGAICTADGRVLSNTVTATVQGPRSEHRAVGDRQSRRGLGQ